MGYIRRLPNKAWWILLGLAAIFHILSINPQSDLFKGVIWLAYTIWFLIYIGSSKELKIGIKILYFFLFGWLLMGLSLAAGLLIVHISMLGIKH